MSVIYYPAILERGEENFGVFFPDLPGCIAAEDTAEAALISAEEVLALFLDHHIENNIELPKPSKFECIEADPDVTEVARVLIKAEISSKKIRVNITLDESLVEAIDKIAKNRSEFISKAARQMLAT